MSRKRPRRWFASLELLLGYFSAFLDAQNELLHGHRDTLWGGNPMIRSQQPLPSREVKANVKKSVPLVSRYHRGLKPPELQQFASRKVKCYLSRAAFEIGQLANHIHPSAFDPDLITRLRRAREDVLKYLTSASPALEGRVIEHQFAELLDQLESLPTIEKKQFESAVNARLPGSQVVSPQEMEPTDDSSQLANLGSATHSADYRTVNWYGLEHIFTSMQASAVKALWEESKRSQLGLHQNAIRMAVDPERDTFRMDAIFRNHKAFRTMIISAGKGTGIYKLAFRGKSHNAKNE